MAVTVTTRSIFVEHTDTEVPVTTPSAPLPPCVPSGEFVLNTKVTLSDAIQAIQREQDDRVVQEDAAPLSTRPDLIPVFADAFVELFLSDTDRNRGFNRGFYLLTDEDFTALHEYRRQRPVRMSSVVFDDDAVHYFLENIQPGMISQVVAAGARLLIIPDRDAFNSWKASVME